MFENRICFIVMEINDSIKVSLIRKGNELFNLRKIDEAYRCYLTASYFSGMERIADYYFEKQNVVKAYKLYKHIQKNESSIEGSVRIKKKIENVALIFIKVIREWTEKDSKKDTNRTKRDCLISNAKDVLDKKNKFHTREK